MKKLENSKTKIKNTKPSPMSEIQELDCEEVGQVSGAPEVENAPLP